MKHKHIDEMPRPALATSSTLLEILSTLVFVLAVTVLFDMAIPRSLVEGKSMEPTFHSSDRLVVSRVHYLLDKPQRGDIVVFNSLKQREAERGVMLIKRVIGLPGEKVTLRNQQVAIDGMVLDEPYIKEACIRFSCQEGERLLKDKEYFVMGDNRNNSNDSRSFGAVPLQNIVGKVILRYFPLQSVGLIPS